jgi:hypothetical protein
MKQRIGLRRNSRKARPAVLVLALLWLPLICSGIRTQEASAQQEHATAHHSFKEVSTGKAGPTAGALEASVHSYESEDGTLVIQLREWYKSPSDARSGLDALTKKASRIIKQGAKKDAEGRVIGNRAEFVVSHGHRASPEMVIAWADGATVVRLSSTSLPLLLDFENQYYP